MAPLKCLPSFLLKDMLIEPALSCFSVILTSSDLLLLLCPVTLVFSLFIIFFFLMSYRFSYIAYKMLIIILLLQPDCFFLINLAIADKLQNDSNIITNSPKRV